MVIILYCAVILKRPYFCLFVQNTENIGRILVQLSLLPEKAFSEGLRLCYKYMTSDYVILCYHIKERPYFCLFVQNTENVSATFY